MLRKSLGHRLCLPAGPPAALLPASVYLQMPVLQAPLSCARSMLPPLQKLGAQAARQQQKAAASSASAEAEGEESSSSEEEDEEDPEALISHKTQAQIFETLLKIRAKDASIYQPEAKFYSSSSEDEGEEDQGGGAGASAGEGRQGQGMAGAAPQVQWLSAFVRRARRQFACCLLPAMHRPPRRLACAASFLRKVACPQCIKCPAPSSQLLLPRPALGCCRQEEGAANVPERHCVPAGPSGGRHRLGWVGGRAARGRRKQVLRGCNRG